MNSDYLTPLMNLDPDVYKTAVIVFILVLVMRFILSMLRKFLDHKLKNKIIDKGLSEEFASVLLQADRNSEILNYMKWFAIVLSTGIGLFIATFIPPFGLHSIAILAISISLGFLAFALYLKRIDK